LSLNFGITYNSASSIGVNEVSGRILERYSGSQNRAKLLIDPNVSTVQFYSLVSSPKGYGRITVDAVVRCTPDDWNLVVVMDWSGGFWKKMVDDYSQIIVF